MELKEDEKNIEINRLNKLLDRFSDITSRFDIEGRFGLSFVLARRGPVSSYPGSLARKFE